MKHPRQLAAILLWLNLVVLAFNLFDTSLHRNLGALQIQGVIAILSVAACLYAQALAGQKWARAALFISPLLLNPWIVSAYVQAVMVTAMLGNAPSIQGISITPAFYALQFIAAGLLYAKSGREWFAQRSAEGTGSVDMAWFALALAAPFAIGIPFVGATIGGSLVVFFLVMGGAGVVAFAILYSIANKRFKTPGARSVAIVASFLISFSMLAEPAVKIVSRHFQTYGKWESGWKDKKQEQRRSRPKLPIEEHNRIVQEFIPNVSFANYQEEPFSFFEGMPPVGFRVSLDIRQQQPLIEHAAIAFKHDIAPGLGIRVQCTKFSSSYYNRELNIYYPSKAPSARVQFLCAPSIIATMYSNSICFAPVQLTDDQLNKEEVSPRLYVLGPDNSQKYQPFYAWLDAPIPATSKMRDMRFWQQTVNALNDESAFIKAGFSKCMTRKRLSSKTSGGPPSLEPYKVCYCKS